MEVLEAIRTLRATRRFSGKPVEEEQIAIILEAATMAPSGGNSQPWEFVVVRDDKRKAEVKNVFIRTSSPMARRILDKFPPKTKRMYEEATELIENFEKVPLIILACVNRDKASRTPETYFASIYPAVQNMMLAGKSLGIGSCLTTHGTTPERGEDDLKKMLSIPNHIDIAATLCFGYPSLPLGPPKRLSYKNFTHWEKW